MISNVFVKERGGCQLPADGDGRKAAKQKEAEEEGGGGMAGKDDKDWQGLARMAGNDRVTSPSLYALARFKNKFAAGSQSMLNL